MNENAQNPTKNDDKTQIAAEMLGSLLLFTRVFHRELTGRELNVAQLVGREQRQITICRFLTDVFNLLHRYNYLNIPPGTGKTLHVVNFVAWATAIYPDSNHLYVSNNVTLAAEQTGVIRDIMSLKLYEELFAVRLRRDSKAKDSFKTEQGGQISAFGSSGSIVGHNAGLPGVNRYSGAYLLDDPHNPDDIVSSIKTDKTHWAYNNNANQRLRGTNVPIIMWGQRTGANDLFSIATKGSDGNEWHGIVLKAIDDAGNNIMPDIKTTEQLLIIKEHQPYVWAAQYQQDPTSLGNTLYRREDF